MLNTIQLVPEQLFPFLVDTTEKVVSLVAEISTVITVAVPTEHCENTFTPKKVEKSIRRKTNLPNNTESRVLIIRKTGFYRLGR
jgi:hypothetical protein